MNITTLPELVDEKHITTHEAITHRAFTDLRSHHIPIHFATENAVGSPVSDAEFGVIEEELFDLEWEIYWRLNTEL